MRKTSSEKKAADIPANLRAWISAEITMQLRELKEQINKEVVEDLKILQKTIADEVTREVIGQVTTRMNGDIDRKVKSATTRLVDSARTEIISNVEKKIAHIDRTNNQIVVANNQQLAAANEKTREMIIAVGQQVCDTVYERVITEINTEVVPKVNNMVQWVNYNMQDGGEVVDSYRRAVENQHRPDPKIKLLTDGHRDKRIITEHIRTFFSDSSSSED